MVTRLLLLPRLRPVTPSKFIPLNNSTTAASSFSVHSRFQPTRLQQRKMSTNNGSSSTYRKIPYHSPTDTAAFPYSSADLTPSDSSSDADFYSSPRVGVQHIDNGAIAALKRYYTTALPRPTTGKVVRIMDFCSSWTSHLPPEFVEIATRTARALASDSVDGQEVQGLYVVGVGMNQRELDANSALALRVVRDLNTQPSLEDIVPTAGESRLYDAGLCALSIDYMTSPLSILESLRRVSKPGAEIHLVISDRCFPTKAVRRWLQLSVEERLQMVGDYLWWSGWREIEIIVVKEGGRGETSMWGLLRGLAGASGNEDEQNESVGDPLWVVRGRNPIVD